MVESVRWRRLRWRLRGAWQWPTFIALTLLDALLVARLPFQGEGTDAMGAFLVAGFFNLVAVALLAPFFGMLLRRRRRDLPMLIARDYAGAVLLLVTTFGLLAGGLTHRAAVLEERRDQRAVVAAVSHYVSAADPRFMVGLGTMDRVRLETDSYRVCVMGTEKLPLCLFVNTDQSPAGVKRDTSREPNGPLMDR
jgi:uncharacterized membrane protein